MPVDGLDSLLRQMVRDEVRAILAERDAAASVVRRSPFALSDTELVAAERLLDEPERPILRSRVMAWRMDEKGYHRHADRMRRKADNLERKLELQKRRA